MEASAEVQPAEYLSKDLKIALGICVGLALFWVTFLWNFWDRDVYALGINATVFLFLLLSVFVWVLFKSGHYSRFDLFWLVPLALVALSYSIYDNPFLKMTSLLVLPVFFAVFYNQAFLQNKTDEYWDLKFISRITARFFSLLSKVPDSASLYIKLLIPTNQTKKRLIVRVCGGIFIFLVISLFIFIPLLSAADASFAAIVNAMYNWFNEILSLPLIKKILVFIVLSIILSSAILAWSRHFDYKGGAENDKKIDPIISGIVLGGVLCLYVLFLWIQISRLWVGTLPFDFKETESLVKSGFWQLLFLSVINIAIYFFTYRKTIGVVQKILIAFMGASLLLLISAGYRMGLYVTYYGFSYEKFFASYTVIFCAILFVWLITRLFLRHRSNIFKFLVVLFLWMYAVVSIFPVEQFIVRSNMALSQLKDSRIKLFELTMLSPDVLDLIKKYEQEGLLREKLGYLASEGSAGLDEEFDWKPWIERQEKRLSDKRWYEKNLTNIID